MSDLKQTLKAAIAEHGYGAALRTLGEVIEEARQEIADMTAALNGIHNALDECLMVPANVLPAWNAVIDILRRWHEANEASPPERA